MPKPIKIKGKAGPIIASGSIKIPVKPANKPIGIKINGVKISAMTKPSNLKGKVNIKNPT